MYCQSVHVHPGPVCLLVNQMSMRLDNPIYPQVTVSSHPLLSVLFCNWLWFITGAGNLSARHLSFNAQFGTLVFGCLEFITCNPIYLLLWLPIIGRCKELNHCYLCSIKRMNCHLCVNWVTCTKILGSNLDIEAMFWMPGDIVCEVVPLKCCYCLWMCNLFRNFIT